MSAKHKTILDTLRDELLNEVYPVGGLFPTEQELATRFGVARQTVLKALATLKNDGILSGVRGRGTFVTRLPAPDGGLRDKLFYFVCANLRDSFGHEVFLGFESEAARQGYAVIAGNSDYDTLKEAHYLQLMRSRGVAGAAVIPYFHHNRDSVLSLCASGFPLVCVDQHYDTDAVPHVTIDNFQSAYDATVSLIASGRRRIAYITNTFEALGSVSTIRQRFAGYRRALEDHGLAFRREWVQEIGAAMAARRPVEVGLDLYGYQAAHKLLHAAPRPDALVLQWDELAPGAYNAIRNSGLRIPDDIAVSGFNDDDLCVLLTPQLTTVRQPARLLGVTAARLTIARVEKREVPPVTVLPCELIARESTRRPREASGEPWRTGAEADAKSPVESLVALDG